MVCTANQVRSAMAERMLQRHLGVLAPQLPIDVSGAGTRAGEGNAMLPLAAAQLHARGISAGGFSSRPLTEQLAAAADLILTATREHRSAVLERVPLALKRTFTLREFAALAGGGVPRPDAAGAPISELVRSASARRGSAPLGTDEYDIDDPAGLGEADYAYAARLIEAATLTIAQALSLWRGSEQG